MKDKFKLNMKLKLYKKDGSESESNQDDNNTTK